MAWPSIAAPTDIIATFLKGIHTGKFETGRPFSRAAHTKGRSRFQLRWSAMSDADLDLLLAAVEADAGTTFAWTRPRKGTVYTVGYETGKVAHKESGTFPGYFEVDVVLVEQ
jgi:hypothetical protein